MSTVNMLQAKTQLSKLVEAVESGAEEEIIIARNGKPAARLVPIAAKKKIRLGLAEGKYDISMWTDPEVRHAENIAMLEASTARDEEVLRALEEKDAGQQGDDAASA